VRVHGGSQAAERTAAPGVVEALEIRQMDRSLGRIWPRAVSKLYEEPKKLTARGLARASTEQNGQRTRTVYAITDEGRRALAAWLQQPGEGPVTCRYRNPEEDRRASGVLRMIAALDLASLCRCFPLSGARVGCCLPLL